MNKYKIMMKNSNHCKTKFKSTAQRKRVLNGMKNRIKRKVLKKKKNVGFLRKNFFLFDFFRTVKKILEVSFLKVLSGEKIGEDSKNITLE